MSLRHLSSLYQHTNASQADQQTRRRTGQHVSETCRAPSLNRQDHQHFAAEMQLCRVCVSCFRVFSSLFYPLADLSYWLTRRGFDFRLLSLCLVCVSVSSILLLYHTCSATPSVLSTSYCAQLYPSTLVHVNNSSSDPCHDQVFTAHRPLITHHGSDSTRCL